MESRLEAWIPPYSAAAVADLRERLARTRWPETLEEAGWSSGTDAGFLKDLCRYWATEFDWEQEIERLRAWNHGLYLAKEGRVHFLHARGNGPSPMPLILTHGWPGSFLEMLELIPRLTDPAAFGGDERDAFDVVVPSLPGFGYSDKPRPAGVNFFRVAEMWAGLMRELGYERFAAQGGDLGAGVTTALGLRHAECLIGIHLNFISGSYRPHLPEGAALSEAEQRFLRDAAAWYDENGAYAHIQGTRPQTLSYGLHDSPAGLAAWIVEKFRAWSDCGGDVLRSFTRDRLLANITLYWMTESIGSSFGMYQEGRRTPLRFGAEDFVRAPCGIACFPKEILFPPRAWVERGYNVQRWTEMPRGGHFAAAEQPELLAEDLRAFFRPLRG
ncbi:epoxide hydrolase family protein [Silvibacterium dinghuense]|uniref:Epoxide hydrolase n=1 Tax=Silvibacterium dinghuense TaxID=1560006 RepID=A0A4Q1S968_9BACT|nr:epoxide hydrolase family protein [Silvibacterium dinghuense]RXS93236.1 epoxide hydrolase [Silvibacterium dinghuense]GGH04143.1 multidrug MFS transporter [Silvibacterium dinghuense]